MFKPTDPMTKKMFGIIYEMKSEIKEALKEESHKFKFEPFWHGFALNWGTVWLEVKADLWACKFTVLETRHTVYDMKDPKSIDDIFARIEALRKEQECRQA